MTTELVDWYRGNADLVAWTLGWGAALGASQIMKLYLPPKTKPNDVKRILNSVAVGVGGLLAFMLWPDKINGADVYLMRKIGFALSAGLSAPAAYTLGKAFLEWQFPAFAEKLSWDNLKH